MIKILQMFFEIRHDRFCQKLTNELRSSTPVLFLRLVPVKEVVDVIEAENVVPLSAAKRVKPLEDESVSECIELAELEKYGGEKMVKVVVGNKRDQVGGLTD